MSTGRHEQALIDAISAAPDDEVRRLIYADWLEDRGDPFAELIRLEIARSQQSPLDAAYWKTKAQLLAIRQQIPEPRRAAIGYGDAYFPMFRTLPDDRASRWRLMDRFIDAWYPGRRGGPNVLNGSSGDSLAVIDAEERRLGCRLPLAFREFYQITGRDLRYWNEQDRWTYLNSIDPVENGDLVFRFENQGCCTWKIRVEDLENPDPPVWCDEGSVLRQDSSTLTGFALMALVNETRFFEEPSELPEHLIPEVRQKLSRSALGENYWFYDPIEIWEGKDLLFLPCTSGMLYFNARSQSAFDIFSPELRGHFHPLRE